MFKFFFCFFYFRRDRLFSPYLKINEEAEENQMRTVVCRLYSHVQEPSLLPVIEYAADQMTKIAFEGSRLLNLTVLYLSQTTQLFPTTSPKDLLQVCRDAFRAVCAKKS